MDKKPRPSWTKWLPLMLLSLTACADKPTVIRDRCALDHVITASHRDTQETQDAILQHNADYLKACR